ncbi:hypothetical protein N9Z27_01420 [Alphaproteobacteria bacterium]|nr:hypothetical protein [Alphaproteobacteria bacterium]
MTNNADWQIVCHEIKEALQDLMYNQIQKENFYETLKALAEKRRKPLADFASTRVLEGRFYGFNEAANYQEEDMILGIPAQKFAPSEICLLAEATGTRINVQSFIHDMPIEEDGDDEPSFLLPSVSFKPTSPSFEPPKPYTPDSDDSWSSPDI